MLLKTYHKRFLRPECNPSFQSLHLIAELDQDVTPALPYLNTVLGGDEYTREPAALMLKVHGRLITIQGRRIAVNALKDTNEADRILKWLKKEINEAWSRRSEIRPSFEGRKKPLLIEILKRLPRTNCRECGQQTCLVFASLVVEGAKGPEECPALADEGLEYLQLYLRGFSFD